MIVIYEMFYTMYICMLVYHVRYYVSVYCYTIQVTHTGMFLGYMQKYTVYYKFISSEFE